MRRISLIICAAGTAWLAAIGASDARAFFHAYLFAYLYWLSFPLGALGLVMVLNLTGGRWGDYTRRILEAMCRTTEGMALAILPLIPGLPFLYPWDEARAHQSLSARLSTHQATYFNPDFFGARTLIYFVCWVGLTRLLTREPRDEAQARSFSAGGLVVLGFTVTFASVDWQMSLEPLWHSTIYGMLFAIGQSLQAWAFAVAVLISILPGQAIAKPSDLVMRDIGNILLTLVVLWAYLSFMQYLIIWSGNLPDEVTWVLARTRGGWLIPVILLAAFQFAAPFSALLLRFAKERGAVLRAIAIGIVAIRIIEQYWLVMPAFSPGVFQAHAADLAAWIALGGFWLWLFLRNLRSRAYFPGMPSSPLLREAVHA